MLCQFSVTNFRSIKNKITLDMQAASITDHEKEIINELDGEKFLPLAVLYGPNAGGKTTVLDALFMLYFKVMIPVLVAAGKHKGGMPREVECFKFSKENCKMPTEFDLFFRTETSEYRYQLHLDKKLINYESLNKKLINGKRETELYTRTENNVEFKSNFKKINVKEVNDSLPILSFLMMTQKNNDVIKDIEDWFIKKLTFISFNVEGDFLELPSSGKFKKIYMSMLQEMNLGVSDYIIEEKEKQKDDIYTIHIINNKKYKLELEKESDGTLKIMEVLPPIIRALDLGGTLIMDELDAKLHPVLLKYIINLFRKPISNPNKAQLIFTSHDMSTMSNELFRRDEIWFVAKNNEESTEIYSLIDIKGSNEKTPRKDAKFDKQYLEGKFGADPYLNKMINWGEYYERS